MSKDPLKSPHLYINRELSWLEFNDRVLREGLRDDLPLLERVKFLGIVSSNLDEFFLVRVAGLARQRAAGVRRRDPAGLTPEKQLEAIAARVRRMIDEQAEGIRLALAELVAEGLRVYEPAEWTEEQRLYLRSHFQREILPVLTPLAIEELDPPPLLPNLQLHLAVLTEVEEEGQPVQRVAVVPVPTQFSRFVDMHAEQGVGLARLEDVMAACIDVLFAGRGVLATAAFRITRDADVIIGDDDATELLETVEQAVRSRRRRNAVRLTIAASPDARIKTWLTNWLKLLPDEVYELPVANDAAMLMELAGWPGYDQLRIDDWPPQTPRDLLGADDLWGAVKDHDVLLVHPYESFQPVIELLEKAAVDPNVLAIKQTLYRTSGNSPIVRALQQAAEMGKEVTVLVELRARFDEARNVAWARRLEDAGAHVIYGVAGLKTHAKTLLIVRRENQRIQRYVHLATGNYNERTAKLYSDIGLLTCDREIAGDVAAFFNVLTGYSESIGWSKLVIAPTGLKQRFLELIERETDVSTADQPGLILAKTNSLQDPDIARALYRASQKGVRIRLNVRGVCVLRPGVPGVSDSIEVRSIVDRYLEHTRAFYFRNGGHEEVYLASADWMRRNLHKRLEIMFPVVDPAARRRVIGMLDTYFADNMQARELLPDGTYRKVQREGAKVRAQERLYREALAESRTAQKALQQFQPLKGGEGS